MAENKSNYTEKEKNKLITAEITRLNELCAVMSEDRIATAKGLIEEAAFMSVTLRDIRATVNKEGVTSIYQNGENQWGTKKSPEVEVYNTMIKNYLQVMKQIVELLPDPASVDVASEIMAFMGAK